MRAALFLLRTHRTANQAQYISELFSAMGVENSPLHSRKSQAFRTRVSNEFRDARQGVIVASDVAAREASTALVQGEVKNGSSRVSHVLSYRPGR